MGTRYVVSLAILGLLVGCGASQQPIVQDATGSVAEARAEAVYSDALAAAIDTYERDLRAASSSWYSSYENAWAAHRELVDPDLGQHVEAALALRGRTVSDLNAFSEAHPDFVREQNRVHQDRLASLRPLAYAVMGRIDRDRSRLRPSRIREIAPRPEPELDVNALAQATLP